LIKDDFCAILLKREENVYILQKIGFLIMCCQKIIRHNVWFKLLVLVIAQALLLTNVSLFLSPGVCYSSEQECHQIALGMQNFIPFLSQNIKGIKRFCLESTTDNWGKYNEVINQPFLAFNSFDYWVYANKQSFVCNEVMNNVVLRNKNVNAIGPPDILAEKIVSVL